MNRIGFQRLNYSNWPLLPRTNHLSAGPNRPTASLAGNGGASNPTRPATPSHGHPDRNAPSSRLAVSYLLPMILHVTRFSLTMPSAPGAPMAGWS